jgi:hypothetical protein
MLNHTAASSNNLFIKISPEFLGRIRFQLAKTGLSERSIGSLIGSFCELASPLFSGRYLRSTIKSLANLIHRKRSQTSEIIRRLCKAGVLEKVHCGRLGIKLRLLILPDGDNVEPTPKKTLEPPMVLPPLPSDKEAAIEIRLEEIANSPTGFKKTRAKTEAYLRSNIKPDEITSAIARDREREAQETQAQEAQETLSAAKEAQRSRKQDAIDCLKGMSDFARNMLMDRAEKLLPLGLQRAKPTNTIRVKAVFDLAVEIVAKDLV